MRRPGRLPTAPKAKQRASTDQASTSVQGHRQAAGRSWEQGMQQRRAAAWSRACAAHLAEQRAECRRVALQKVAGGWRGQQRLHPEGRLLMGRHGWRHGPARPRLRGAAARACGPGEKWAAAAVAVGGGCKRLAAAVACKPARDPKVQAGGHQARAAAAPSGSCGSCPPRLSGSSSPFGCLVFWKCTQAALGTVAPLLKLTGCRHAAYQNR